MFSRQKFPELVTERLILEPFNSRHSDGVFALWSSSEVCLYSGDAYDWDGNLIRLPARSPSDSDLILEFFIRRANEGSGVRWAIISRADARCLGAVGLNSVEPFAEIAYHLHPDCWGSGYAGEACESVITWIRENLAVAEIEAFILPENDRSITLAKRLGFVSTPHSKDGARRYVLDAI